MAGEAFSVFGLELQENMSGAATAAGNALEQLKARIKDDTRALSEMQRAMKNLQSGSSVNISQFKDLEAKIKATKDRVAGAQAEFLRLGGNFRRTPKPIRDTNASLAELLARSQQLGGPLGNLSNRMAGLRGLFVGGAIAIGALTIGAALLALAAAAGVAVVALGKYGAAQADARRSELLRLEGMTKMRNWWGIAAGNAGEIQTHIDQVTASVPIARDQVSGLATELYRAGLRGGNLQAALEGSALAMATQGQAGVAQFKALALGAAMTGRSVRAVADDYKARLGPIAERQMMSLTVQSRKLRESFSMLFSGLKIERFLGFVKSFTDMFSQSTASGRALKTILEGLFNPLFDAVGGGGMIVKRFFQGLVIGALALTIGILRLRNWFRRTFGDVEIIKGMDLQRMALLAGVVVVGALAAAIGSLVIGFGVLAASVALAVAPMIWLTKKFAEGIAAIKNLGWKDGGLAMMRGLVDGIFSGAAFVWDAIKKVARGALDVFKSENEIRSPARKWRLQGGLPLAQGVRQGIEQGAGGVQAAASRLVDVPAIPLGRGAASAPQGGGVRNDRSVAVSVTIENWHGGADAKREAMSFRDLLAEQLEQLGLTLAAPEPA